MNILKKKDFSEISRKNSIESLIFLLLLDIRVGIEVETNPATLITRTMEDYITWSDGSTIKRKILSYKDKLDDYDLLE